MYKVDNPYGECQIMDLNMMGISEYKKSKFSASSILVMCAPLVIAVGVALSTVVPELGFFAECQNIPGGDVCSISIK